MRSNIGLIALFFFLTITFMFLMIGHFVENERVFTAGGGFGIVTAAIAFYCACANLYSPASNFFSLPLGPIPKDKPS